MAVRIICVGNRLAPGDDLGPRVHDLLSEMELPEGVEVMDGGLGGLDLAGFVEGADRVIFVDAVIDCAEPGEVAVLDPLEELKDADPGYGHSNGLAYMMKVLPSLVEGEPPPVRLVGAASPCDDTMVARLAGTCLALAADGLLWKPRASRIET